VHIAPDAHTVVFEDRPAGTAIPLISLIFHVGLSDLTADAGIAQVFSTK
jgi:hypothetical protein